MLECSLFVYGTLKRRQKNHIYLTGTEFVGNAVLTGPYEMYLEPNGNYPFLALSSSGPQKIFGEVYRITEKSQLQFLDDFEDVPHLFERVKVLVRLHRYGRFPEYHRSFMYLSNLERSFPEHGPSVESGNYSDPAC